MKNKLKEEASRETFFISMPIRKGIDSMEVYVHIYTHIRWHKKKNKIPEKLWNNKKTGLEIVYLKS